MQLSMLEPKRTDHPLRKILIDAILDYENDRPRTRQRRLGPSEVGTPCARQLAYKLIDQAPVSPDLDRWASIVGTALHGMMACALIADNQRSGEIRWLVEQRVTMRPGLDGSTDAYHVPTATVIDHKFVGVTSLKEYRSNGPGRQYRTQGHLYGKGWVNAGLPVKDIAICFYPRTSHTLSGTHLWSEPFDMSIADAAMARMDTVLALAAGLECDDNPDRYLAIPKSPGEFCRYCPWLRPGQDTGKSCAGNLEMTA